MTCGHTAAQLKSQVCQSDSSLLRGIQPRSHLHLWSPETHSDTREPRTQTTYMCMHERSAKGNRKRRRFISEGNRCSSGVAEERLGIPLSVAKLFDVSENERERQEIVNFIKAQGLVIILAGGTEDKHEPNVQWRKATKETRSVCSLAEHYYR